MRNMEGQIEFESDWKEEGMRGWVGGKIKMKRTKEIKKRRKMRNMEEQIGYKGGWKGEGMRGWVGRKIKRILDK